MNNPFRKPLSRRETQIMDVIFQMDGATAADIVERLPDPPSYSSIRALLTILEAKGHLTHRKEGARYIYSPTLSVDKAKKSALSHLIKTFFSNSPQQVVATLLSTNDLSPEDLDELAKLIQEARKDEDES
ncbi:MAG: BlaI/MecI/CopY family transcriptional regulator [Chloroflexota bacterium]|nr:BlaI/MecI/CopY family transcriptional regulator [Anaerolineae bacterium]